MPKDRKKTQERLADTASKYARLIAALKTRPSSATELSEKSGLSIRAARVYVKALRESSPKLAYVHSWGTSPVNGMTYARYKFGDKPDADPPEKTALTIIPKTTNSIFNLAKYV